MTCIRFVRTIRKDGHFRSLPAEATRFWRTHGAIVGEVLRCECALTFAEIVVACKEYVLEDPQVSLLSFLDEAHIAWCLIKLLEYGMIGSVVEAPNAACLVDGR